jgi:hypothetical protein
VLSHSIANRYTLSACSNRVCCVLDIGACDDSTARQQQSTTDTEVGVRAFERICQQLYLCQILLFFAYKICLDVHPSKRKRTVSLRLCFNAFFREQIDFAAREAVDKSSILT